ncbi:MAG: DinB family protein [Gemmataceae bacterium]|nr:DinB family protein [Gemmataceae bacterium]
MDPCLKPWVELWDYLDGNFWNVYHWAETCLGPEELAWQPIREVASIGWNLQHLAEMLDLYLSQIFCVRDRLAGAWPTMIAGSLDEGRWRDLKAIGDYHRQVRPAYRRFLEGLAAADLERVVERRGRRSITWSWAVGHIAEHESYHLGKCRLLASLLKRREVR